jgi:DNA replication protein DnaC
VVVNLEPIVRTLRARLKNVSDLALTSAELMIVDDLFLRRLPSNAGDELADVLMSRYEKFSTLITSNR